LAPCSMLLVAARGAPGPLDEVRRMPREAIINHLHTYALAGLEAIAREHALRQPPRSNRVSAAKQRGRSRPIGSKNWLHRRQREPTGVLMQLLAIRVRQGSARPLALCRSARKRPLCGDQSEIANVADGSLWTSRGCDSTSWMRPFRPRWPKQTVANANCRLQAVLPMRRF